MNEALLYPTFDASAFRISRAQAGHERAVSVGYNPTATRKSSFVPFV